MAKISPRHVVIALSFAIAAIILPMGIAFLPWVFVVGIAVWLELKRQRAAATFWTYVVIMAVVVVATVAAPVKTVDQVLERKVVLPKTDIAPGEMTWDDPTSGWLPRYIHVTVTPETPPPPIHFRTTEITLREFVDTIEAQSKRRHRFMHCGNGSSILYGGDCSFGLHIREPRELA